METGSCVFLMERNKTNSLWSRAPHVPETLDVPLRDEKQKNSFQLPKLQNEMQPHGV